MFKGELTLTDIMWNLPKKRLYELRDVRRKSLIAEEKEMERIREVQESDAIRNRIMAK